MSRSKTLHTAFSTSETCSPEAIDDRIKSAGCCYVQELGRFEDAGTYLLNIYQLIASIVQRFAPLRDNIVRRLYLAKLSRGGKKNLCYPVGADAH